MHRILVFFLVLMSVSTSSMASEGLVAEIKELYAFSPHNLSTEEQQTRTVALDTFWDKVESNKNEYLPILRRELSRENHSPFFYYDGSKLLLHLSNSMSDKQIAVNAIPKTDLKDVNNTDYLKTITYLSIEGFDTSTAALHILSLPSFKAYIPIHSLTLGQNYSLISMLMPLDKTLYIDKVLGFSETETNDVNLKSLILVLWYADTIRSLMQIETMAKSSKYSQQVQQTASELARYDESFSSDVPVEKIDNLRRELEISENLSYEEIGEIRRKRFNRISDEALIELDQLTYFLKKARVENAL